MRYSSMSHPEQEKTVRNYAYDVLLGNTLIWNRGNEQRVISLAIIHDMMKSDRDIIDRIFAMADNKHELKDYIDDQATQYALEDVRAALEEFNTMPEGL